MPVPETAIPEAGGQPHVRSQSRTTNLGNGTALRYNVQLVQNKNFTVYATTVRNILNKSVGSRDVEAVKSLGGQGVEIAEQDDIIC